MSGNPILTIDDQWYDFRTSVPQDGDHILYRSQVAYDGFHVIWNANWTLQLNDLIADAFSWIPIERAQLPGS